ncbi:MAG: LCP family protein [Eubacteriales bacterium]
MSRDKREKKSYQSYEMKMSPAARRRQRSGKRNGEEYVTTSISLDMTEQELVDVWDDYDDNNWTESIRRQVEVQEYFFEDEAFDEAPRRARNQRPNNQKNSNQRNNSQRNNNQRNNSQRNNSQRNNSQRNNNSELRNQRTGNITSRENDKRVGKRAGKKPRKDLFGLLLSNIEIIATLFFLASLLLLNVLPVMFVVVIVIILVTIAVLIRLTQMTKRKHRLLGKIASIVCSVLLMIGAYYCIISFILLGNIAGENDSGLALNQDTYSIYISGIDVYGDIDLESRSDVNIIATVNPSTGEVLLTTTPRDYYVEIPGVSNGQKDKLTHAGNYGIDASMDTLENLYDQSIDFYIRVNFTSFINIIDVLGGVTVNSEIAFTVSPWDGNNFDVQIGDNYLTGTQALAFCRERYNLTEGDAQRGKNQQAMIVAIVNKFMMPSSILQMDTILECIEGDVETNLTRSQLQQFCKGILKNILGLNMYSVAAEGTTSNEYCYSYSSTALSVTVPSQDSVNMISSYMDDVEEGNALPIE